MTAALDFNDNQKHPVLSLFTSCLLGLSVWENVFLGITSPALKYSILIFVVPPVISSHNRSRLVALVWKYQCVIRTQKRIIYWNVRIYSSLIWPISKLCIIHCPVVNDERMKEYNCLATISMVEQFPAVSWRGGKIKSQHTQTYGKELADVSYVCFKPTNYVS